MRGLTLIQPWATLVAIGAKRIETRSWSTTYRGLIAIHAAKGFPREARRLCSTSPFMEALRPVRGASVNLGAIPCGAIVAVAELVDVFRTDVYCVPGERRAQEHAFGDFTPGRYAWLLENVHRVDPSLGWKGALGLWPVSAGDEAYLADYVGVGGVSHR